MNLLVKQKETQQKMNSWLPGGMDGWGFWKGHAHTAMFRVD